MSLETYDPGPPKPKRKDPGGDFQDLIRDNLDAWQEAGLGLTETCPRFVGRIDKTGRAVGRVTSKGDVDYVGDWRGRAFKFDAKSTGETGRFDLDLIADHQVVRLRQAHERGGLSGVLLEMRGAPKVFAYYLLPWPLLARYFDAIAAERPGAKARRSIPLSVVLAEGVSVQRKHRAVMLPQALEAWKP